MQLANFLYATLLKPKPIRRLANTVICFLIPDRITFNDTIVVLNQRDPVVSGALALGLYEKDEISFLSQAVQKGMKILDIGANVGLYTAILGKGSGDQGRVYAFEPDPENFRFLQRTIAANKLLHVHAVQAAAAAEAGKMRLFTSSENRGDNRLYGNELSDGFVDVDVIRLDDFLQGEGVENIDLIKIDVQGYEAEVLKGLENTVRSSQALTLLAEFWPDGLRRAGADPLELLHRLQSWGFRIHSLEAKGKIQPIVNLEAFIERFPGRNYTNIVGIKQGLPLRECVW